MKRFTIPIIASVLLLLGYLGWRFRAENHDVAREIFGSSEFYNTFIGSPQVTAQRLHQINNTPLTADPLSHYEKGTQTSVALAQVQEIRRLLHQPRSYDWSTEYEKACMPIYGVLINFQSDSNAVSVALCFDCNMLAVYERSGTNTTRLNTEWDFDPIRKQLVAVIKPIFPNDAEIQKLR